jgi:hypothetical protein
MQNTKIDQVPTLNAVTADELALVAGGYDEGFSCGTPYPHGPIPHSIDMMSQVAQVNVAKVSLASQGMLVR